MAESYTYENLSARDEDGTISVEGAAWLLGYERAVAHFGYGEAYGTQYGKGVDAPSILVKNELDTFFAAGVDQAKEDRENEA